MKRRSNNEAFAHISVPPLAVQQTQRTSANNSASNTPRGGSQSRNTITTIIVESNNNNNNRRVQFSNDATNNSHHQDDQQTVLLTNDQINQLQQQQHTYSVHASGDPRLHTVIADVHVRGLSQVLRPPRKSSPKKELFADLHENQQEQPSTPTAPGLGGAKQPLPVAWCADTDGSITVRRGDDPSKILIKIPKKDQGQFVTCLAEVTNQNQVWAGYSDGCIRVYEIRTGLLVEELWHHEGAVSCLVVGSDSLVYSGAQDWKVYQWDPVTRQFLRLFFGHANSVRCLVTAQGHPWRNVFVSHQRRRAAEISLYQQEAAVAAAQQQQEKDNNKNVVEGATLRGESPLPSIREQLQGQTPSRSFPPAPITREARLQLLMNPQPPHGLHLSLPRRAVLFSGSDDGTIRVWDALAPRQHTKDVACLHTFSGQHSKGVHTLLLHFETSTLWSGGEDASIVVWDLESCNCLTNLGGVHSAPITSMISVENDTIWTGGKDGIVVIWNALKRYPLREFRSRTIGSYVSSITSMARTETRKIWCTFSDGTLQVWTVECPYGSGQQRDLIDQATVQAAEELDAQQAHQLQHQMIAGSAQNSPDKQQQQQQDPNVSLTSVGSTTAVGDSSSDPTVARLEKKLKFSESVIRSCRSAMKATEDERDAERRRANELQNQLQDALQRLETLALLKPQITSGSPSRSASKLVQQQQSRGVSETNTLGSSIIVPNEEDVANKTTTTPTSVRRNLLSVEQDQQNHESRPRKSSPHRLHELNDLAAAVELAARQSEENDRLQNEVITLKKEIEKLGGNVSRVEEQHQEQEEERSIARQLKEQTEVKEKELKAVQQQLQIQLQHSQETETQNKELVSQVERLKQQLADAEEEKEKMTILLSSASAAREESEARPAAELRSASAATTVLGGAATNNQQQQQKLSLLDQSQQREPTANTNLPREVLEEKLRLAETENVDLREKVREKDDELQEAQKLLDLHAQEIQRLEEKNKNRDVVVAVSTNKSAQFSQETTDRETQDDPLATENKSAQFGQETSERQTQSSPSRLGGTNSSTSPVRDLLNREKAEQDRDSEVKIAEIVQEREELKVKLQEAQEHINRFADVKRQLSEAQERQSIAEQRTSDAEAQVELSNARCTDLEIQLQAKQLELTLALSSLRAFGKDLSELTFDSTKTVHQQQQQKSTTGSPIGKRSSQNNNNGFNDQSFSGGVNNNTSAVSSSSSPISPNTAQQQQQQSSSISVPQHVLASQLAQVKNSIHSITAANDARQELLNQLNLRHSRDARIIQRLQKRNGKLVSLLQRQFLTMTNNQQQQTEEDLEAEAARIAQDEQEMTEICERVEELEAEKEKTQVTLQHSLDAQKSLSIELAQLKKALSKMEPQEHYSESANNRERLLLNTIKELVGVSDAKQKVISEQRDIISENSRLTQLLNCRIGNNGLINNSSLINQHLLDETEQDQFIQEAEEILGNEADEQQQQVKNEKFTRTSQSQSPPSHYNNNNNNVEAASTVSVSTIMQREEFIELKTVLESLLILVETAFKAEHDLRRIQMLSEEDKILIDPQQDQELRELLAAQEEFERKEEIRKDEVEAAGSPPRIRSASPGNRTSRAKKTREEERLHERKLLELLRKSRFQLPSAASSCSFTERCRFAAEALTLHLSHLAHIDETIVSKMRSLYEVSTHEAISSDMLSLHVPKTVLKDRVQKEQNSTNEDVDQQHAEKSLVDLLKRRNLTSAEGPADDNDEEDSNTKIFKNSPTFAAHAWEHCLIQVVDRAVDRLRLQRLAFDGALRRTQNLKARVLALSSESKNSTDMLERKAAALQEKQHDTIREWHEGHRADLVLAVWDTFSGVRAGLQRLSQHTAKLQAQLPREWRALQMAADVNEIISAFSVSFNRSQFILAECLTDEEKEELEKTGRARATAVLQNSTTTNQQQVNFFSPSSNSSVTPRRDYFAPQSQQVPISSNEIGNAFVRTPPSSSKSTPVTPNNNRKQ